jgi:hypothetical protein
MRSAQLIFANDFFIDPYDFFMNDLDAIVAARDDHVLRGKRG